MCFERCDGCLWMGLFSNRPFRREESRSDFKGEKPGDIPWELGEKLLLLINEKAAKTQGAIISPELFKKADKVITE